MEVCSHRNAQSLCKYYACIISFFFLYVAFLSVSLSLLANNIVATHLSAFFRSVDMWKPLRSKSKSSCFQYQQKSHLIDLRFMVKRTVLRYRESYQSNTRRKKKHSRRCIALQMSSWDTGRDEFLTKNIKETTRILRWKNGTKRLRFVPELPVIVVEQMRNNWVCMWERKTASQTDWVRVSNRNRDGAKNVWVCEKKFLVEEIGACFEHEKSAPIRPHRNFFHSVCSG